MQNSEERVRLLHEAIKREDHNEVYEYSKMLLKDYPSDEDYQLCFVIASLKISLHEELAHQAFKVPPTAEPLQSLYAYYLYATGDHEKSLKYLSTLKPTAHLRLLRAQNYFKTHQYSQCAQLMLVLLKEQKLAHEDRETYMVNLLSTGINKTLTLQAAREYQLQMVAITCRELLYNYALLLLDARDYAKCREYLNQFEKTLTVGVDSNDIVSVELLRDYLSWQEGENKDKTERYSHHEQAVTDLNLKGVIRNNLLYMQRGEIQSVHDSLRMLDECLEPEFKMTRQQSTTLLLNKLSIYLRKNKLPEAFKVFREMESPEQMDSLLRNPEYLKSKYYFLKKSKDNDLPSFIAQVAKTQPTLSFCMRADLSRERGGETQLIGELKSNTAESGHPAIKNYLFSLIMRNPLLFDQYSEYLSDLLGMTQDYNVLEILLNVYQNKRDEVKQQIILQKMLKLRPKNSPVKVKMVKLFLKNGKVQQAEEALRGVDEPDQIGDVAYLQFIEKNIHVSKKDDEAVALPGKKDQKKKIKKKKRCRLPNKMEKFIEGFRGDPERWLPKWQRKGYKKKGKKAGGKTQGLATVDKAETKNVYTTAASTSTKQVTKDGPKKRK